MSTLYLIRHGQASFGAADYDVLSPLGQAQSAALGGFLAGYFAARAAPLDAVYTGPRRRQRDTTRHMLDRARDVGGAFPERWPDPVEVAELDEYPAFELVRHWMPALAATDPDLHAQLLPGADVGPRVGEAYQRLFAKWARGELDTGPLETFGAFAARVRRGLGHIMEREGRGRRVAVVTSGGPISVAVQMALDITDERTIEIAWVLANSSVSEFRFRDSSRLGLVSLNGISHLAEPALITYR